MDPTLHPNLARLAAAYDEILERYGRGQINASSARAEILALESRDDQGVRWSIDPDTGDWVRRTAMGGAATDAPPQWGYETPDAFDFTRDPTAFNPADRTSTYAVDESLIYAPAGLAGSTRVATPEPQAATGLRATLAGVPMRWRVGAVAVALLAGFAITSQTAEPTPSAPADPTTVIAPDVTVPEPPPAP